MDELRIKLTTKFMRGILSKLISKMIYKKYGYKVNVHIKYMDIWNIDGDTNIDLNLGVKMDSEEFGKLIGKIGLGD